MEQKLAGRVALVTGCSRWVGIGFAIACRLADMGADLYLHGYSAYDAGQPWGSTQGEVSQMLDKLRGSGCKAEYQDADLSEPGAAAWLMDAAVQTYGHIDILVANHAYSTMGNLEQLRLEEIDRHLHVNVRATMLLIKAFAAQHKAAEGGRIVLLTSGQHLGPMSDELAYIASKGALHPLVTSLAAHLAPRAITVNAVNPGATDTGYATPELYQHVLALEPQGRWGKPGDAARLVAWLCTADAAWITGQVINSNGGGP